MSAEENKTLVRHIFDELNRQNLDVIDEHFVEDYVHHDPNLPPDAQRGRDNYKQGVAMFYSAFPDLHGTVEEIVAEGDRVVTLLRWHGTHQGELMGIPATGNTVDFAMIEIARLEDGKIAESWANFDALTMLSRSARSRNQNPPARRDASRSATAGLSLSACALTPERPASDRATALWKISGRRPVYGSDDAGLAVKPEPKVLPKAET